MVVLMKDVTAGAGSDDPAFSLIASLSSHALSVDWNHVVSGVHWHRQKREINRQKETPAKGRGSENSAGVCPCFHPVSFFLTIKPYPSGIGMQPVVTSGVNGTGLGYASASWLSPHRDAQLLTPSDDL